MSLSIPTSRPLALPGATTWIFPAPFVSNPTPTPSIDASIKKQKGAVGSSFRSAHFYRLGGQGKTRTRATSVFMVLSSVGHYMDATSWAGRSDFQASYLVGRFDNPRTTSQFPVSNGEIDKNATTYVQRTISTMKTSLPVRPNEGPVHSFSPTAVEKIVFLKGNCLTHRKLPCTRVSTPSPAKITPQYNSPHPSQIYFRDYPGKSSNTTLLICRSACFHTSMLPSVLTKAQLFKAAYSRLSVVSLDPIAQIPRPGGKNFITNIRRYISCADLWAWFITWPKVQQQ